MSVVEKYGGTTRRQAFRDLVSIFIEHASDDSFSLVPGHSYFLELDNDRAKQNLRATYSDCEACEIPHRSTGPAWVAFVATGGG